MKVLSNPRAPGGAEEAGERSQGCPYLQRATYTSRYPIEGYCLAQPDGGLRVVTIAEFHELCTKTEHVCCELYRTRREHAQAEGKPEQGGA